MAKIFNCKEAECSGPVDANDFTILKTGGCSISSLAYPCSSCGRLHRDDGEPLFLMPGIKVFKRHGKIEQEQRREE